MFKKLIIVIILSVFSTVAYASDSKDMSACLPDKIGDFKSSSKITVSNHKDEVISVSCEYLYKGNRVNMFVWKLPGNKEIWPYIGGQAKAQMILVSGRLCVLNVNETTKITTLVITIDKSYVSPPPFLYKVTVSTSSKEGEKIVQAIAAKLNYDPLFALYEK